jgi:hypothetical protein
MAMPDYGPPDRTLRAADADRDAVAETLREQHLAGRLDTDELQARIERSFDAKTYAELDVLLADLPGEEPSARARTGSSRPPGVAFTAFLPLVIVALVLSHGHALWLALPLAFFWFVIRPLRWQATSSGACRSSWRASVPHASRS